MAQILVVDDELPICETLSWILEKEGHQVITSMDFTEATNLITTKNFDLYLIDLTLPGGNGIDLVKLIKDLDKKGNVIILTRYSKITTLVDSVRLNIYDYIKKPIDKNNLKKIVNHALLLQNEYHLKKIGAKNKNHTIHEQMKKILKFSISNGNNK